MKNGAPSNVARNVFDTLYTEQKNLPFEEMIICTDLRFKNILAKKFKGVRIISIKEIFKINKEDIVHIPMSPLVFPNTKFLLHLFAKLNNNKIILNYHGDLRTEIRLKYKFEKKVEFMNLPTYLLIPSLLACNNKVIVNSYLLENLIVKNYGVKSVEVIPNGIESYWFSEDQEKAVKSENICNVFYHGRLSPEKGVNILIEGFHEFLSEKNYPNNIKLYIAGEGSQREYLQSITQRLNIAENIIFLGNVDKNLIKAYLKGMNGAIYPSIWDNFPLSIMEALASANCPVFFSKKTGIYDFLTKEDVLNVFNPDVKIVTEIFHYIFENRINEKTVESQKRFAEKYTWDKIIDYYIKLYKDTVNS